MSTPAQILANRANSQQSTGPKTPEGKQKVAHNAVKNALTGATVLLPTDDATLYRQQLENALAKWQPAADDEKILVQSIVDTEWRLQRIPALVSGIYALGRLTHADLFSDQPDHLRSTLLETYIFENHRRDLNNLALQERRLRNHRENDIAELKQLQDERRKREESRIKAAAHLYHDFLKKQGIFARRGNERFRPADFGFEFSIEEIEYQCGVHEARVVSSNYPEQYAKHRASELRAQRLAA